MDAVTSILEDLESVASDPELDPSEKVAKLRVIRDSLSSALGRAQSYIGDAQLQQEGGASKTVRAVLDARNRADMREALIADGDATAAQMDAAGYLSHEELDRLAEEHLLHEALQAQEAVPPFSLIPTAIYTTEGDLPEGESLLPWLLAEADSVGDYTEQLHPRDRRGRWRPNPEALWRRYAELGRRENRARAEVSDVEQQLLQKWIERHGQESTPTGGNAVQYRHIRGEQHVHSKYSDGHSTIEELAQEAMRRGHEYVVVSDHAHLLTPQKIRRQHAEIDALNEKYKGKLRIIKGVEANIKEDGSIDLSAKQLREFEHVNAGIHVDKHKNAHARLMKALDNPDIHVLAHPHTSDGVKYDELAKKAKRKGVALEVNGRDILRYGREEQATEMVRAAKKHGVKMQIASDSHAASTDFTDTRYAVRLAATEGVTRDDLRHAEPRDPEDKISVVGKPPVKPEIVALVRRLQLDRPLEDVPMTEKAKALLGSAHNTAELYAPGGSYTPGRRAVHKKLLDEMFAGAKRQPEGKRAALFMAGGGASGKSVALRRDPSLTPPDAISINPDEFKMRLPEWNYLVKKDPPEPHAAHMLHEESATLAAMALDRAYREGYNVVVDAVGNSGPGKFTSKIKKAKSKGYATRVLFVDAPTNIAIERNVQRASTAGHPDERRFLPIPAQKHTHRQAISRIKDWWADPSVDTWQIWRTVDLNNPIHVAEGGKGKKRVIHDQTQLDDMWEKARERDA